MKKRNLLKFILILFFNCYLSSILYSNEKVYCFNPSKTTRLSFETNIPDLEDIIYADKIINFEINNKIYGLSKNSENNQIILLYGAKEFNANGISELKINYMVFLLTSTCIVLGGVSLIFFLLFVKPKSLSKTVSLVSPKSPNPK